MTKHADWAGIFPAATTKFTDTGALDAAACERHFAWLLDRGCNGLIVSGSLGEGSTLTMEEKLELARIARAASGGRVPVLLTIAEGSTARMLSLLRRAEAQGVDGVMLLPPMMYHAAAEETLAWFTAAAQATALPLMIYNNPVSYRIDITVEMLRRLADLPGIVAVKESSDDVRRITSIRIALGDRLRIFTGVDNLALESCLMGADGWVAGLVDAFPAETVAVWRLARAGRLAEALAIYRWFAPLLELDVSPRLVQNIKLAEAMAGVGTETVRAPRQKLAGAERARVEAIIREALRTRPALAARVAA